MTKTYLIIIASFLVFSCYTREKFKEKGLEDIQRKNSADKRMQKLKSSFEEKDYLNFFSLFPNTYRELVNFYGFDDIEGKMPLYDQYEDHINFLFNYKEKIDTSVFAKKVCEIAKDGYWDADAVALFQSNLSKMIIGETNVILEVLGTMNSEEVKGFWHFVFDGSSKNDIQNKEQFDKIYNKVILINPLQGELLKVEFDKMYN